MFAIKYPLFVSASLLAVLAASAAAQGPVAVTPPLSFTWNYSFPPIGLAGTETLQVNVANTSTQLLTSTTATASCTGTISFANASGMAIGTPVPFTVGSGQIYSAPLLFSKTGYSNRGEILASVQQNVQLSLSSPCSLTISLEIFDASTGVIHAFLTSPAPAAAPLFGILPLAVDHP